MNAPATVTAGPAAVTDQPAPPPVPVSRAARRAAARAQQRADDRADRAQQEADGRAARAQKEEARNERRAKRAKARAVWQDKLPGRAAAAAAAVSVLGIAGYAGVFAYDSLYKLAEKHSKYVPLQWLAPIGFEATLAGIVIWDLYTTWHEQPVWFLRWIARLFIAFSVIGNAWAGWPDPAGIFFHLPAPIGFAVIVEAIRLILLRKITKVKARERGTRSVARDPIPLARWLNDPVGTYLFYRRWTMYNPQNPDYLAQVELEILRLEALHTLRKYFEQRGEKKWKKSAPPNYLWQLYRGVNTAAVHEAIIAEFQIIVIKRALGNPGSGSSPTRTGGRRGRRTGSADRRRTGAPDRSGTGAETGNGTAPADPPQTGAETTLGTAPETSVPASQAAVSGWQQNVWRRAVARGETQGLTADAYVEQYRGHAIELVRQFTAEHDGKFPDKQEFAQLLGIQKVQVVRLHDEIKLQLGVVR